MGGRTVVTQVTSFSRNGLSDWLIQRVSSLILLAYFLFIGFQIASGIDYTSWRALHDTTAIKVFTLLAIGAYVSHAWIGLWTVFTDYLTEYMLGKMGNVVRPVVQTLIWESYPSKRASRVCCAELSPVYCLRAGRRDGDRRANAANRSQGDYSAGTDRGLNRTATS